MNFRAQNMKKFYRLLKAYEIAIRADEWKGSCLPDEWPEIERRYRETKKALIKYVEELNKFFIATE